MTELEIIGSLKDVKVLIDREARTVILGTTPPIKFSIDHPYIQGTKLEKDARAALDRPPVVQSNSDPASNHHRGNE